MIQAFLKKWWVESDFKAPNLPLSLRLKGSGCHYNSIYNSATQIPVNKRVIRSSNFRYKQCLILKKQNKNKRRCSRRESSSYLTSDIRYIAVKWTGNYLISKSYRTPINRANNIYRSLTPEQNSNWASFFAEIILYWVI